MSYQSDGAGTDPWFVTVQLTSIVPPASTTAGAVALATIKSGTVKVIGTARTLFVSSVSPWRLLSSATNSK